MKAIISNRIYLRPKDVKHEQERQEKLTRKIEKRISRVGVKQYAAVDVIKNYSIIKGIYSIPNGRLDLIPSEYEVEDRRVFDDVPFPDPLIPLREAQEPVVAEVNDTCIINAKVGWGKSITALHIARKLHQKTLIVAHNTMLRDQWVENVEKVFGFTPAIVGEGKLPSNMDEVPITVGNIQTLVKFVLPLSKMFGTLIVDECLDYNCTVETLEFGKKKIGTLVNNRLECHVRSLNLNTGLVEYKKVLNWFKTPEVLCLNIGHSGGGSIKATHNHNFYTVENSNIVKKPAIDLKVGDLLLQDKIGHKSTSIINKEWLPIIIGLVLGDGCLTYPHKKSDSVRLQVTHGQEQLEYFLWKKKILEDAGASCTITEGLSGYNKNNKIFTLQTNSFFDHFELYNSIYRKGANGGFSKREISQSIIDYFDIRTWAIVYQDDGSISDKSITFSLCEFSVKTLNRLQYSLIKLFNIKSSKIFTCNRGFNYLKLNVKDSETFLEKVKNLIHPDLYYKFGSHNTIPEDFLFEAPDISLFNNGFSYRKITSITGSTLTGSNKYNIHVEGNNNYFANGVLVSNCHHCPATTFTKFIDSCHARYRIGLSGTLTRTDGRHVLFPDYFGHKVIAPPESDTLTPRVVMLPSGLFVPPDLDYAKKLNHIFYDDGFAQFIAGLAKSQISEGYSILIPAERTEFLKKIKELIGESCAIVTGETSYDERQEILRKIESKEIMCIAGSRSIWTEGISANRLSMLILCSPTANPAVIDQITGRIRRKADGKLDPVVLDIYHASPAEKATARKRLALYGQWGWKVLKS